MTDLLQHAFETVRRLPPEAQDHIAEAILALAAEEAAPDGVLFQVSPDFMRNFLRASMSRRSPMRAYEKPCRRPFISIY